MEIDKSNMRQVIVDFPKQLQVGLELARDVKVTGPFENVIVCGLGGSALPADIAKALGVDLYVHKNYDLPFFADQKSLIICISYSGNTEEVLSSFSQAIAKKATIICMASGGKLEALALQHSIPFIKLPSGIQPRSSLGYMFAALMAVLASSGVGQDVSAQILESVGQLEKINSAMEQKGKDLAKKLIKQLPILYACDHGASMAIARIWKIKFNENTKIPAFYNYFPELNHNEMVGYEGLKKLGLGNVHVIILKDPSSHQRNLKRIDLTSTLMQESGAKVEVVTLEEGSAIFKVFSSLLLGDWTSYYLALEYKTDPTPVAMVEEFKKLMSQ